MCNFQQSLLIVQSREHNLQGGCPEQVTQSPKWELEVTSSVFQLRIDHQQSHSCHNSQHDLVGVTLISNTTMECLKQASGVIVTQCWQLSTGKVSPQMLKDAQVI